MTDAQKEAQLTHLEDQQRAMIENRYGEIRSIADGHIEANPSQAQWLATVVLARFHGDRYRLGEDTLK